MIWNRFKEKKPPLDLTVIFVRCRYPTFHWMGKYQDFSRCSYTEEPDLWIKYPDKTDLNDKSPLVMKEEGEWISIKEKLPANHGYYLVMVNLQYRNGDTLQFMKVDLFLSDTNIFLMELDKKVPYEITHWRELPSAPLLLGDK